MDERWGKECRVLNVGYDDVGLAATSAAAANNVAAVASNTSFRVVDGISTGRCAIISEIASADFLLVDLSGAPDAMAARVCEEGGTGTPAAYKQRIMWQNDAPR